MKLLDCFCGLGGASEGFHKEGFDCTGIEINPEIARLYPYKSIIADMRDLDGKDYRGYDIIWGSPPCRDFSCTTYFGKKYWKDKPNTERGLELVNCFLKFVEDAKPKIWIMENVPGLSKFLEIPPVCVMLLQEPRMKRAFWGNFPSLLMPCYIGKRLKADITGKFRSWQRAKIPLACSLAFAKACKEILIE